MKKILYIKTVDSPFIGIDEKILKNNFETIIYKFSQSGKIITFLLSCIRLFTFMCANKRRYEIIIIMFVDYFTPIPALLSRILKKKFIIIVGGYDAVSYPDFSFGVFSKPIKSKFAYITYKCADYIIPNHESLEYGLNTYIDSKVRYIGVKYFIPKLKAKFKIIYNGYFKDYANIDKCKNKDEKMIVLVGKVSSSNNPKNPEKPFPLKGYDLFIEAAKEMSNYNFTLIGICGDYLQLAQEKYSIEKIRNLRIIEHLDQFNLKKIYEKAKIIVHPSLSEGMPNVLCEAMLHKCIPVGSNVNGIPLAIGDTGVIVMKRDVNMLVNGIKKALTMDTGEKARQRILDNFSYEKREFELVNLIKEV